jgi:tetratricopeptide (TPR) repeat protein
VKLTIVVLALFLPALSLAQSPISQYSPTVPVQQLATSRKAERALKKGASLLRKHQLVASVSYFRTAIELDPDCFFAYHELALAHYGLGHVDDTEQEFQKSIEISRAQFAPSLFGLAMILYHRQDYLGAESLIEKGLAVAPSSGIGEYCLGLVQFSLGHIPEAQRSALKALRLDRSQADA